MIPRVGKTLIYGDGGSYKTTVIYDLCVAVASGGLLLNQFPVHKYGPVLINSTEDSIPENKHRLMRIWRSHKVNPGNMPLWFCHEPFMLDEQQDLNELDANLAEKRPLILMLDPLDNFFSGDENSARETKPFRRALNHFVSKYELSAIIIHHSAKDKPTPRGSSSLYGWADAVIHVKAHKKKIGLAEPVNIATVTSNKQRNGPNGKVFSVAPIFDDSRNTVHFAFYDGKDTRGVVLECIKSLAYKALVTYGQPMTGTMIANAIGLRVDKIGEALDSLAAEGYIAKDAVVYRNWGPGGSRQRGVAAWRGIKPFTLADQAECIMQQSAYNCEEDDANERHLIVPEIKREQGNGSQLCFKTL
jgi:hypothetical protein